MPSPPEFGDALGKIGQVEIDGQFVAKQFRQPHRNQRITAKIRVNAEGESIQQGNQIQFWENKEEWAGEGSVASRRLSATTSLRKNPVIKCREAPSQSTSDNRFGEI